MGNFMNRNNDIITYFCRISGILKKTKTNWRDKITIQLCLWGIFECGRLWQPPKSEFCAPVFEPLVSDLACTSFPDPELPVRADCDSEGLVVEMNRLRWFASRLFSALSEILFRTWLLVTALPLALPAALAPVPFWRLAELAVLAPE